MASVRMTQVTALVLRAVAAGARLYGRDLHPVGTGLRAFPRVRVREPRPVRGAQGGRAVLDDGGKGRNRVQSGLVVTQVALALVLLVGSGLMARSFAAIRSVDPGFEQEGRLTFRVSLPSAEYAGIEGPRAFYPAFADRLTATAGSRMPR